MALLNLALEPLKVGTTWRGLPSIDFDPDMVSDLVGVTTTFRESVHSETALTLTDGDGHTITDAVNHVFTTERRVLDLRAGTYLFCTECEFADGTLYAHITGVQEILP